MEALDNPSYFTVGRKFSLLKRRGLMSSQPSDPSQRRSHRAILRSLSAQNDSSLLMLGNPRLCDMAPQNRPQARRRAGSSASDIVPPSLKSVDDDEEVFLSSGGDARYYNLGTTLPSALGGRRRHSIGTFLRPVPLRTDDAAHSTRKRCEHCTERSDKCTDVLDIVFLSSKETAASSWVNYLQTCFQQVRKEQSKPPFKLECIKVEDVLAGMIKFVQNEKLSKAHLQIIIVCPEFLKKISEQPGPASILGSLLNPDRVLAMLLGVTDDMVNAQHRTALFFYEQWRRRIVKDKDPTFVGDFLGEAMDFLSRPWQLQQAIKQINKDENKAEFSLLPKKIKMGQNKLLALMIDPMKPDDNFKISIDKNGQNLEVKSIKRKNPYTLQFSIPASCLQVSMLINIVIEKNGKSLGQRRIKCESRMGELDQILRTSDNPLQFMCQTLGLSPGDKEQLDSFLTGAMQRNIPPHFNLLQPIGQQSYCSGEEYPTLLHFAARFGLEKLTWQLLECPGGEQACQLRNTCQLTPADMAERAGYTKLANALKGYLQMTELSSMYSYLKGISENQSPDFNEMNYLLPRPLNDTYLIPPTARPINSSTSSPSTSSPQYTNIDCYQIPPSPVSIAEALDYHIPPLPLPFQASLKNCQVLENTSNSLHTFQNLSPTDKTLKDTYLEMNSTNNPGSANNIRQNLRLKLNQNHYQNFKVDMSLNHSLSSESISGSQNLNNHRISSSSSSASTNGKQSVHGAQDELVEIINDFKNNVFTISEVEKLVENWQNRHDVQQSFKEKQEQLNQMREEYERIQKNMKEQLKRPTPFEKIRKFFGRKSKGSGYNEECKLKDNPKMPQINNSLSSHRPVSSLSLQSSCSSSSSGHLSTGSGTSLGDSGTHSDSEERKIIQTLKFETKAKMSSGKLCTEVSQSTLADQKLQIAENNLNCDLTKCEQTKSECFTSIRNSLSLEDKIIELEEFQKSSSSNVSIERGTVLLEKQKHTSDQTTEEIAMTLPSTDKNICIGTKELGMDQSGKKSQCNKLFFLGNESNENEFKIDGLSPVVCASHSSDSMTSLSSTTSDFPELKRNNSLTDEINSKNNLDTVSKYLDKLEKLPEEDVENVEVTQEPNKNSQEKTEEIICESILEQIETDENFDLPDYVNITAQPLPPVPPRSECSHM